MQKNKNIFVYFLTLSNCVKAQYVGLRSNKTPTKRNSASNYKLNLLNILTILTLSFYPQSASSAVLNLSGTYNLCPAAGPTTSCYTVLYQNGPGVPGPFRIFFYDPSSNVFDVVPGVSPTGDPTLIGPRTFTLECDESLCYCGDALGTCATPSTFTWPPATPAPPTTDSPPPAPPTSPPMTDEMPVYMIPRPAGMGVAGIPAPTKNVTYICPNVTRDAAGNVVYPRYDVGHPKAGMIIEEEINKGFVARLVPCIRNTIFFAAHKMMNGVGTESGKGLFEAIRMILVPIATLAIAIFGVAVVAGKASITQEGMVLGLKLGATLLFFSYAGAYYQNLIFSVQYFLELLAKPVVASDAFLWKGGDLCTISGGALVSETNVMSLWSILDCYIDIFIGGITSNITITSGIVGFIFAIIFSSSVGVLIGMVGLYFLLTCIFTIARALYIFITSYVAVCFMMMISCFFIPCILFQSTKKYFDGWLSLTISFLIQPIFIIGYLVMFLVAFNTIVFNGKNSLYYTIAGEASEITTPPFKLGDWLFNSGAYYEKVMDVNWTKLNFRAAGEAIGTNKLSLTSSSLAKKDTGMEDKMGQIATKDGKKFEPRTDENPYSYVTGGVSVSALNWSNLAKKRYPTEWATEEAALVAAGIAEDDRKAVLDEKFTTPFQISILLSFIMCALLMYLFFSLLGYIPYIGNAATAGGGGIAFGTGGMSLPGSQLFSGVGR